jgi:hypothetical protein
MTRRRRGLTSGGLRAFDSAPIQSSTSDRSQPTSRPRNRHCFGKRLTSVSAFSSQRCRRVRRATSCAVRISCQGGNRSLTHFERDTEWPRPLVGATISGPGTPVLMVFQSHDVWFRSFRDELSLTAKYSISIQESQLEFRAKFRTNRWWPRGMRNRGRGSDSRLAKNRREMTRNLTSPRRRAGVSVDSLAIAA